MLLLLLLYAYFISALKEKYEWERNIEEDECKCWCWVSYTYAITFLRVDWTERLSLSFFFFSTDIMMRDKGDERIAFSAKNTIFCILKYLTSYSQGFFYKQIFSYYYIIMIIRMINIYKYFRVDECIIDRFSWWHCLPFAVIDVATVIYIFFWISYHWWRKRRKEDNKRNDATVAVYNGGICTIIYYSTQPPHRERIIA
jgi:hypothetical protein